MKKQFILIVLFFLISTNSHSQVFAPKESTTIDDIGSVEDFDPRVSDVQNFESDDQYQNYGLDIGPDRPMSRPGRAVLEYQAKLMRDNFRSYSEHPRIVSLIETARLNLQKKSYVVRQYDPDKKVTHFVTYCFRAVKEALQGSGILNYYLSGDEANEGVIQLTRAGFRNLMDIPQYEQILRNNPRLAPKGMILVYKTNPHYNPGPNCGKCARPSQAGHIEIKSSDAGVDGYISVSVTQKPTYGYLIPQQRLLIGVMYKARL